MQLPFYSLMYIYLGGLSWTCDLATEWAQLLLLLTSRSALLSQVKSGLIEPVALRYELTWMEIKRKLPAQEKRGCMIEHAEKTYQNVTI